MKKTFIISIITSAALLVAACGGSDTPTQETIAISNNNTASTESKNAISIPTEIEALLSKNTCTTCHAVETKLVGPAYKEVALKNYTAEQMTVALQKLGSSVSVGNTLDGIRFNVQSLKVNLDKTLALLEERMMNPKFSQDAFNRLQKQALEGFKQAKSQPATIASNVYSKLTYGADNILGMNDNGTEYTIKNLTLADVEEYYKTFLTSNRTKIVVVGNLSEEETLSKLTFINKLPNVNLPFVKPTAKSNVEKTTIYLVDVPRAAQTEFRIGKVLDMPYNLTGEYYKADLMNYVLGANFNSRVNLNLREDKGWTYGARGNFSGNKYSVEYTFSSGIRANATDSALTEVLKEINNYAKNGITDEEVTFMKSALGQRDALLYETPGQKSGFVGRLL
jgi:zinc protease